MGAAAAQIGGRVGAAAGLLGATAASTAIVSTAALTGGVPAVQDVAGLVAGAAAVGAAALAARRSARAGRAAWSVLGGTAAAWTIAQARFMADTHLAGAPGAGGAAALGYLRGTHVLVLGLLLLFFAGPAPDGQARRIGALALPVGAAAAIAGGLAQGGSFDVLAVSHHAAGALAVAAAAGLAIWHGGRPDAAGGTGSPGLLLAAVVALAGAGSATAQLASAGAHGGASELGWVMGLGLLALAATRVRSAAVESDVAPTAPAAAAETTSPPPAAVPVDRPLTELEEALLRRELVLHYRPCPAVGGPDATGVMAVVRWQHPLRGLVEGDEFLPEAAATGLIGALGAWVVQEACSQAAAWQSALSGRRLVMAVEVHPDQLDDAFCDTVGEILRLTGLPASHLALALPAGGDALAGHGPRAVLRGLDALGVLVISSDATAARVAEPALRSAAR